MLIDGKFIQQGVFMTISEVLKYLMFVRDMRVSDLAREAKVPQQTLQRIVAGLSPNPHMSTLQPLADYFNLTVDQLRGAADIPGLFSSRQAKGSPWHELPLLTWDEASVYEQIDYGNLVGKERVLTEAKVSDRAYVLKMEDSSMEPIYPVGTVLIVDPEQELQDRRYIIVRIKGEARSIIRWVTTDGRDYYLRLLNPELSAAGITKLTPEDKICGIVVQAKRDLI